MSSYSCLTLGMDVCSWICESLRDSYSRQDANCDLILECDKAFIKCHRILLATISPWMGMVLKTSSGDHVQEDDVILQFVDLHPDEIKGFLDQVYFSLTDSSSTEISVTRNVAQVLGMHDESLHSARDHMVHLKDEDEDDPMPSDTDFTIHEDEIPAVSLKPSRKKKYISPNQENEQPVAKRRKTQRILNDDNDGIDFNPLDAVVQLQDVTELRAMLQSGIGNVNRVLVMNADWQGQRILPFMQKKSHFRALLGVQKEDQGSEDGPYLAKPLAWSDPENAEDIATQFDLTTSAFRSVFGFSQSQMTNNTILCYKQNILTGNFRKRKQDEVYKGYRSKTPADIQTGLEQCNSQINGFEITTDLFVSQPLPSAKRIVLELDPDLSKDSLTHVIVAIWTKSGVQCFPIQMDPGARDSASEYCLKSLFDVWCTSFKKLPMTEYLKAKYEEIAKYYIAREAFQKLITESTPEKQCPECGTIFDYLTKKDKQRYKNHMDGHEREKFTCDCSISFTDANDKRRHIMLVHTAGKYVKCDQCAYIGTVTQVTNPFLEDPDFPENDNIFAVFFSRLKPIHKAITNLMFVTFAARLFQPGRHSASTPWITKCTSVKYVKLSCMDVTNMPGD